MKLKHHVTISLIFSAFLFVIFKSWKISASSFISGVLIDCDHVFDFFKEFRRRLQIRELFEIYYSKKHIYSWTIFHSWELLFLLGICAFLMSWNPWIIGITMGFTQHIILDQIFNKTNKWEYFFLWRLKNGFIKEKTFPD